MMGNWGTDLSDLFKVKYFKLINLIMNKSNESFPSVISGLAPKNEPFVNTSRKDHVHPAPPPRSPRLRPPPWRHVPDPGPRPPVHEKNQRITAPVARGLQYDSLCGFCGARPVIHASATPSRNNSRCKGRDGLLSNIYLYALH